MADPCGDFVSDFVEHCSREVLEILLRDRTTGANIVWADDERAELGEGFGPDDEIELSALTGGHVGLVRPRAEKEREQQAQRTKARAEVFTPSWLCNSMNNHLDAEWFGRPDAFNTEATSAEDGSHVWTAGSGHVEFDGEPNRGPHAYVNRRVLEITCGEAPFLCSRYDAATGRPIPVRERMGLLDRKLRVVGECARDRDGWACRALDALRATFGFERQGDNLLIARMNMVLTFCEHHRERWGADPDEADLLEAARIASWNLWQMDGLTDAVPTSISGAGTHAVLDDCPQPPEMPEQLSLFGPGADDVESEPPPSVPLCCLHDWTANRPRTFATLKGGAMGKFFYAVIGNPPYQMEPENGSTRALPIYDRFMDEAYALSDRVELITPGRFLFNAGQTRKDWNAKMLADPHLEVLEYTQSSAKVFSGVDIKGGVAITYRDETRQAGPIGLFIPIPELRSIAEKVGPIGEEESLSTVIESQNNYCFEALYEDHPDYRQYISGEGCHSQLKSNALERVPIFTEVPTEDDDYRIFGIVKGQRTYRYCHRRYIQSEHGNLFHYKVLLPGSNGSGAIGEVFATPLVGEPLVGYTQSFIGIGAFDSRESAEALLKYVKSKFARVMLGVLKVTQSNTAPAWRMVPLQDFTSASDIDWSQSVADIDRQLYAKYGLSDEEIDFIETHVKEMS